MPRADELRHATSSTKPDQTFIETPGPERDSGISNQLGTEETQQHVVVSLRGLPERTDKEVEVLDPVTIGLDDWDC